MGGKLVTQLVYTVKKQEEQRRQQRFSGLRVSPQGRDESVML